MDNLELKVALACFVAFGIVMTAMHYLQIEKKLYEQLPLAIRIFIQVSFVLLPFIIFGICLMIFT